MLTSLYAGNEERYTLCGSSGVFVRDRFCTLHSGHGVTMPGGWKHTQGFQRLRSIGGSCAHFFGTRTIGGLSGAMYAG